MGEEGSRVGGDPEDLLLLRQVMTIGKAGETHVKAHLVAVPG